MKRITTILLAAIMLLGFIPTPALAVETVTATPTASTVLVNGKTVAFDAYNINGNNYFKLRDLAYTLSGTAKQFEVGWDGANNAISLTSGKPYTATGGEMTAKGAGNKTAAPTSSKIYLDGKEVTFTAYNIDGNNYFKLRDIGLTFDFSVEWDGAKNTIVIDTSKGYTAEGTAQPTGSTADKPFKQAGVMSDITDISQGTAIYSLINDVISSSYNCVFVYEDNTFRPDKNITKAEFLQMVFHGIAQSDSSMSYKYNPSPDYDHWAEQYLNGVTVSYSAKSIMTEGYNDYSKLQTEWIITKRYFDNPITRGEVAVLAYEYYVLAKTSRYIAEDKTYPYLSNVADKDKILELSDNTKWKINCCIQLGLMELDANGNFNPSDYLTREEALNICVKINPFSDY